MLSLSTGIWVAVGCDVLAFPVFCGIVAGGLPVVRPIFRGDAQRWRVRVFLCLIAAAAIFAALATVLGLRTSGQSLAAVGMTAPGWISWMIVGIFGAFFLLGAAGINPSPDLPAPSEPRLVLLPHTRSERLFMLLVIAPVAAVSEELVYRGLFLTLLTELIGFWPSNLIQAAIFGFHHGGFHQGWQSMTSRVVIGFALGLLVWWHGNLIPAMVIHFLMNASTAARPLKPGKNAA